MVDILSVAVDSTGVTSFRNALTAIFRGVSYVPVNTLVGCGVNSCFKFSNAAVKRVASVDNGILHVAGKNQLDCFLAQSMSTP